MSESSLAVTHINAALPPHLLDLPPQPDLNDPALNDADDDIYEDTVSHHLRIQREIVHNAPLSSELDALPPAEREAH